MDLDRFSVPTPTRAPTGTTNAYRVGDLLIDPATRTDALDAAAESASHVAVTHTHPDHVGAIAEYADSRTVWVLSGHEARFEEATGVAPDATFSAGDRLAGLTVLETPGHAPDHVAFVIDGAIVCGDLAMAEGSTFVGGDGADMTRYLDSLRRLRDRDPRTLYPGHGEVIDAPARRIDWLIEHRLERERRVLRAIEAGNHGIETIREAAYEKDLAGVEDLATLTVEAHLEKLTAEGNIEWDGERARTRP
ncbi:MBL fold metallo-hydrolase [Halalkalicoccus jeotgali]|uniref:Beta-lactamase domain protein n=1 Tax=Halalkalicoccus jeotgali (strain DSM 18796 / CECT 7217 / JCM 14584 / KCTC 4019 / B3) TaxID=795797 RepID=D8J8I1_HALJB|nr:MBL fold metallo-hydrolase [Halalkalicoccus jeotgali]ADJ16227.1 beta-lactamase domain protein [Halalkalicoccus jeotgali B3]ELY37302.1 beta-lactamase domain-containing protein [Halalkalicoccus jeotgali B3]